ncbi:ATPase/kinase [Allomyces macrogynus ATCC 38327]|uniref:ATPase/kinase n=1 Tax=Allomyces macrogynus (strain ATCC 38327) TaxID=578462 RepID=A0A0L0S5D9_ALLM3|nr:ATPase/kinase [Allomyces macrogynus ATCC 38327]|eukprot:KNE57727.1 ATPase/kinase [Allomyces macrogynus ATCC 38327]
MSSTTPKYPLGVCIGKFYPPHAGHLYLMQFARLASTRLVIFVCERGDRIETPSGERRAAWVRAAFPTADVRMVIDTYDQDDSALWARLTVDWLNGVVPDAVFTSESYGDNYARCLTELAEGAKTCAHVAVDRARIAWPVCGTDVRAAPLHPRFWSLIPRLGEGDRAADLIRSDLHVTSLLPPYLRAYYALRVILVGAESTGKSTLAARLAEKFGTRWVHEYGRDATEAKIAAGDVETVVNNDSAAPTCAWKSADFVEIAQAQTAMERAAAAAEDTRRVLVCDTDSLATIIWHERYMAPDVFMNGTGELGDEFCAAAARLEAIATQHADEGHPDHTVYLVPDVKKVPFVQDGTRDGEQIRERMYERFLAELDARNKEYVVLHGDTYDARVDEAVAVIERKLDELSRLPGQSESS